MAPRLKDRAYHCNRCGGDHAFIIESNIFGYPHYQMNCIDCELSSPVFSDTVKGAVEEWQWLMIKYADAKEEEFLGITRGWC